MKTKTFKSVFSTSINSSNEEKKKLNEEPKKRGRPSRAEVEARKEAEKQADLVLRKELIERQKQVSTVASATFPIQAVDMRDPNYVPRYPIFVPGQRVQQTHNDIVFKGTVTYDGIDTPFVRIRWDDGSEQYAAKGNVTLIVKKAYKSLLGKKTKVVEE